MLVEQIYTGCLAQGAYYIESNGEAVVIDPLREVAPYLERAKKNNAKIKYILETHFHADFVSGHINLSKETGAPIVFGPTAAPNFEAYIATDGEVLKVGNLSITVLHTPGHTMESVVYLLKDEKGEDHAIFTGDTLFLGDVGRPDLAQKIGSLTKEDLAGKLYDSLRTKIMPLSDDIIVYPAHGAGSACGKNMMKETLDSLGNQKRMNYALRADMTREEFIEEVLEGLMPSPGYFPQNVQMNKEGYADITEVMNRGLKALSPEEFEQVANAEQPVILDVRKPKDYSESHVPRSIFIGIDGGFAPWVGALIADVQQPILFVADKGREEEVVTRLSRVGFDNCLGYLEGGIEAWKKAGKEYDTVKNVTAKELVDIVSNHANTKVVDVRKLGEFEACHMQTCQPIPLDELSNSFDKLPKENFYIHCAGGYRSMIASSILKNRGYHDFINVSEGMKAIKEAGAEVIENTCTA